MDRMTKHEEQEIASKVYKCLRDGFSQRETAEACGCSRDFVKKIARYMKEAETNEKAKAYLRSINTTNSFADTFCSYTKRLYVDSQAILQGTVFFSDCAKIVYGKNSGYDVNKDKDLAEINTYNAFRFFSYIYNKYGSIKGVAESDIKIEMNNFKGLTSADKDIIEDALSVVLFQKEEYVKLCKNFITLSYIEHCVSTLTGIARNDGTYEDFAAALRKMNEEIIIADEGTISAADPRIEIAEHLSYPLWLRGLDGVTRGFPTGVNAFCGVSGTGKTMFAVQQEIFLAKQGIPVYHVVLGDLRADEYRMRLLANLSGYTYFEISNNRNLYADMIAKYTNILKYITISVNTDSPTIEQILLKYIQDCTKIRGQGFPEPKFVIIDYDDLISYNGKEFEKANHIYPLLQNYGKENDVCFVMVKQPTKGASAETRNDNNRTLSMDDLSGGAAVQRVCALILTLTEAKAAEENPSEKTKCIKVYVAKGRNGGAGKSESIIFYGDRCKYFETKDEFDFEVSSVKDYDKKLMGTQTSIKSFTAEVTNEYDEWIGEE